jgi:hypothetical protein
VSRRNGTALVCADVKCEPKPKREKEKKLTKEARLARATDLHAVHLCRWGDWLTRARPTGATSAPDSHCWSCGMLGWATAKESV